MTHSALPIRPLGLRLIILEKALKALFVLLAASVFAGMLVTGSSVHLHGAATHLREHVTAAWAVYAANAVVSVTERRHLAVATSALILDGLTTGAEWYALRQGKRWGEWVVVVAMAALIPFEVLALVRARHIGRGLVLLGNIVIVAYLVRHALRRRAGDERGSLT